ncbi:MAG: outer membrane beta-barrel protein [Candidatus Omnitrophica bacterium]|nr:outer membrane beta-barrel protein [Candidatus Omnitrophota bacterium]
MMRRFRRISGILVAILLLLRQSLAHAEFKLTDAIQEFGEKRFIKTTPTRLQYGPLKFHPFVRNRIEYDDNILLESRDAREDVVFNIKPGAILEIPLQRHQVAVGYEAEFEIFAKERHAKQNDQNQSFFVLADLQFPSWYINVLEQFSETSGRAGTTFTDRIPRIDQSIHPKIGYHWKRFTVESSFRHFARDFRRQIDDPLDFQLVEWMGVLYYDLFARLKALVDYQFAQIDYDDNFSRNGNINQTRLGLEGQLIPNLTVKLRAGPQFRNYKISGEPNFNSWVAYSEVLYDFRKNLRLKFNFSRDAVEATFENINYYKEHSFGGGFEYRLGSKWIAFTDLKLIRHDYSERSIIDTRTMFRRDHHIFLKPGIRYELQEWISFELAYEYLRRNSNFSEFDFTDHRVGLTTTLSY